MCKGRTEASILFGEVYAYLLKVKQLIIRVGEKWVILIITGQLSVPDYLAAYLLL